MDKLWVTTGDEELFRWLWMLRVMTVEQIRRLRYFQHETGQLSNLNNVRMRLKRLEKAGYLNGEFVRKEGSDTRQKIYLLGKNSLYSLRDFGIEQKQLYDFKNLNAFRQVYHALLVSEFAIRIVESIRGTDVVIPGLQPFVLPFYHTHAIGDPRKKKHVERFITQVDVRGNGGEVYRIRPDLVFALKKGDRTRLFFLEADRGFEGHKEIGVKQRGYWHFAKAGSGGAVSVVPKGKTWQSYGDVQDFRVLFVTTTEKRVQGLRGSLQNAPGFELMAWTTSSQAKEENVVYEPPQH